MEAKKSLNSNEPTARKHEESPVKQRTTIDKIKLYVCENEAHGYVYEPFEVHIEKMKTFQIRNDDILLYTTARAGTHWMFRILDMLITGKAEYRDFHVDQVHMDLELLEDFDKLPSPRLLQTHMPFKFLPQQIKDKRTKIVHVYRNPKALAVSFYMLMKENKNATILETLDKTVDILKTKWTSFYDGLIGFMKENPDHPVFNVSYEEMLADLHSTVKRLRTFLGFSISDDICDEIADACFFDNQKSKEDKMNTEDNIKSEYFRKGGTSDWKNHMTVAQSEDIDKFLIERKDRCMFAAKYVD